jgi:hypothetical protein
MSGIIKRVAKEYPETEYAQGALDNWKERLEAKAIVAVEEGLECTKAPYMRGNLGVSRC